MRFPLLLSSAILLPLLSAALPTATPSPGLTALAVIVPPPSITPPPSRRADDDDDDNDDYAPSRTPFSLNLPSRTTRTRPSFTPPPRTCTPGASAYATPGVNGHVPAEACNAMWVYFPSFVAAVAFSILFGALTIAHVVQAVAYRNGFCWVIITASLWETGAYAFRALGSKDQQSSGIAMVAQILVLVAPIWVNAFAYMVFARIVHFYAPSRKVWVFSPSILALVFVTLDVVSFVVQLVGGGMAGPGSSAESQRKGLNIYMGGISMQEGFIVLFLGLVIKFHRGQLRAERLGRSAADKMAGWRWMIWALYACLLAITIRIVYRLAEFSDGLDHSNPLPSNEPLLYVLESTPMWLALLVWNVVHPGRFIRGKDAKMPRSWLSRHLCCCCCCCRKSRCDECHGKLDHAGPHNHRVAGTMKLEENQEMHPIIDTRGARVVAAPADPFRDAASRHSSANGPGRERGLERLRPSPTANDHGGIGAEPTCYAAYRPRELLG